MLDTSKNLHHIDSLVDSDGSCSYQSDDNGGSGRRTLKQDGYKDSDHETANWVGIITKETAGTASSHDLGSITEQIKTNKEEVEEEEDNEQSNESPSPFLRGVNTAALEHFAPGSVHSLFGLGELGGELLMVLLVFAFVFFDIRLYVEVASRASEE